MSIETLDREPSHWRDDVVLSELVLERTRAARRERAAAQLDRAVLAVERSLPPGRLTREEVRIVAAAALHSLTRAPEP
jgi:Flp pilus assembly protein TadB